jgi:hypothetical protein
LGLLHIPPRFEDSLDGRVRDEALKGDGPRVGRTSHAEVGDHLFSVIEKLGSV